MKLLGNYILKEYVKFFFVCLLSLVVVAIVFAAIPELDKLDSENGLTHFVESILSGIPLLIEVITPISVLLSTLLTFLSLQRSSEIVAMSAAGFSRIKMVSPIMLFGIIIGILVYFNQSYLAPMWGADERTSIVKPNSTISTWRFFKGQLYYFSGVSLKTNEVASSTVFQFGPDHAINQIDSYFDLILNQNQWKSSQNSTQIKLGENSFLRTTKTFITTEEGQFPVVFKKEIPYPKYTNFTDLLYGIFDKRAGAVNYENDLFALYQKAAAIFAVFIMILLAIPFSLFSHKESNIRGSVVSAVVLGLIYFLVDQVFLSMNQAQAIPIEISAFGANIVFFILIMFLIRLKSA